MVAFDDDGFFALGTAGFNYVGVDGALGQEGCALMASAAGLEFFGFGLEDIDKELADDFAFLLGVGHAFERIEEELAGIDAHHFGVNFFTPTLTAFAAPREGWFVFGAAVRRTASEHVHDHVAFVQAQEAMINKHAGELIADGAVDERGGDG